jgi:chromosome segregation ATPase
MKDLLDKLKDAGRDALGTFVVLDEDGNEVEVPRDADRPAPPKGSAASRGPAAPAAGAAAPGPAAVASATVDPEFVQQLHAAVQGSKKAAYTQFQTLFSALSAVADPAQRTQLALSACQASHGVAPQQVAEALDDRLKLLAGERQAFDKAVADETEHTIGATQKRIEAAKAEIVKKTEEIRQLEATRAELEKGIAETRAAIDGNAARFAASYAVVEAELAAERARIAPFVTPNPK